MAKHKKHLSSLLLSAGLCLLIAGCGKNVSTTSENTENAEMWNALAQWYLTDETFANEVERLDMGFMK